MRPIARAIADRALAPMCCRTSSATWTSWRASWGRTSGSPATQFSAADIQMSFPVEAARARGGLDEKRPRLMKFLEKIHARPAYRRAVERGGEYALMR